MDAALEELERHQAEWTRTGLEERIAILEQIQGDLIRVAERWVAACAKAKGIEAGSSRVGEEWPGPMILVRLCRLLRDSLRDVLDHGAPRLPGPVTTRADGQIVCPVFPQTVMERVFYNGMTAEVWLDPALDRSRFEVAHAAHSRLNAGEGKVALVLGAGNYSMLGPADILYKLFCEHQVVLFKPNPVAEYLGPLIEEAFAALVRRGVLRIVYGGGKEGAYLTGHSGIDEIHLTGSDKTYEAIVFGPGAEGAERKEQRQPLLDRRFTCELGNVSPTIVVPGPWSKLELEYQAEHIASMITLNAGFNCMSTRVIIQHEAWPLRRRLLDRVRRVLSGTPTREAYYPGAADIHRAFIEAHPEAELLGEPGSGHLPWTLIAGVDASDADDICFTTEPFCSLFSETALAAPDVPEFIDQAVALANDRIWGTLSATLLVHPRSLRDPRVAAAVERAIADLRYGTVAVNIWAGMGYMLGTTSWGAYPGHPSHDIQSGEGTVNNALLLPDVQKSVVRAPFLTHAPQLLPKPPYFVSHRTAPEMFRQLTYFEQDLDLKHLPGILWSAMRG
jgi:acyl-CoA reductase-like NAD-dependent aldehyde dehydrogenase